jgi:hypothetical protein
MESGSLTSYLASLAMLQQSEAIQQQLATTLIAATVESGVTPTTRSDSARFSAEALALLAAEETPR